MQLKMGTAPPRALPIGALAGRHQSAVSHQMVNREGFRRGICLPGSLRERTERGVYAASAWHTVRGVADFPERRELEHGEAA